MTGSPVPIITGIGLVTPLGNTAAENWDALLAGRYITDHAKVPLRFSERLPRVSHLAILAAREAIASNSGPSFGPETALVMGTSKGPVEEWLKAPSGLSDLKSRIEFGLARPANDVADALKLTGPRLTISAACASGLHALIRGAMLIQSGQVHRVLVVAAEASVHPLFLASFRSVGVLPSASVGCRPFDLSREGFLMSEAAAAVLLEACDRPDDSIAIERFAMGADATHLTGSDTGGAALCRIIGNVSANMPFDLIHAHGTGTLLNDSVELAALERSVTISSAPAALFSHKGAIGHTLGVAGLVSTVINVMCHRRQIVPPNIRMTNPMPATNVVLNFGPVRRHVRRSMVLAAGFGGALAAVSLVGQPP